MSRMNFTKRNPKTRNIENTGYMEIKNAANNNVEMYIYGDIVSTAWDAWADEDIYPQEIADFMSQIGNNAEMTIYINSGGGDVFAGIAIYNILKRHTGHKKGVVDGLAASIASVILMACDEITMSAGAQIMVHKPLCVGCGNADDFAKLIGELDKCQKSITDIYMQNVREGVTEEQITALINAETWMDAQEAEAIFNITVDDRPAMAACVGYMMGNYKNKPQGITTESVEDATEKQELEAILEDLDLYGI